MTEFIYLADSYKKELRTKVVSCQQKGKVWEIVLEKTIFYPQGGGQLSDRGEIVSPQGKVTVKHVRMHEGDVIHECSEELPVNCQVTCILDWQWRYLQMRRHSAGHIVHEVVMQITPNLKPLRADHGKELFIEYKGSLPIDKKYEIEKLANQIIDQNLSFQSEMVEYTQLVKRVNFIAGTLPKNKPLRIIRIGEFPWIPDGGTQVVKTGEIGPMTIAKIENTTETVRVYYTIGSEQKEQSTTTSKISAQSLIGEILEVQRDAFNQIQEGKYDPRELALLTQQIRSVPASDRQQVGIVVNEVKKSIEEALKRTSRIEWREMEKEWVDVTMPGIRPPEGHLHIVTQAIMEITRIFERIGFTRVRHPEVDWDWYAFEALNMPQNHPARDECETFFIASSTKKKIVLTPHTSNGQVREMEKKRLPIRMINIAKCYRRQIDVSHTPMFHQFEGMYIDKNVSIAHLKGVFDYFVKQFYGPDRTIRLRPFHFQFTEPSFEVDINCGICLGSGKLSSGQKCRLCKEGWLEMAGSGMIHPAVLRNGGIDPEFYSGFAFGWGVERAYMMKNNTKIDDIRLIYSNDLRFLEQF